MIYKLKEKIATHKKDLFCVGLLLLIAVFTHLTWFFPGVLLTHGDWGYMSTTTLKEIWHTWQTWDGSGTAGQPNIQIPFLLFVSIWSLAAHLGLNYAFATQLTFFIPIVLLCFIAPYFLVKKITKNHYAAFLAALFYATNTYGITNQPPIHMVYALSPIIMYLFIVALEKSKSDYWIYFSLIFTIGVIYEVRIMFLLSIVLTLYFFFFADKNLQKAIKIIGLTGGIVIGLNAYWVAPVVFGHLSQAIADVANRGLFGDALFDLTHSIALSTWQWTGGLQNTVFVKQSVLPFLFLIPLVIISGLITIRDKGSEETKLYAIFFSVIALAGIFMGKQSAEPFTLVYKYIYGHIPGLNLFREASKYYLFVAIGYMGLLGLSIRSLTQISRKLGLVAGALVMCVSLVNLYPIVTQSIGSLFVPRHIPLDYDVFDSFLQADSGQYKTIWVPTTSKWGPYSLLHPKMSLNDLNVYERSATSVNVGYVPSNLENTRPLQKQYSPVSLKNLNIKYVVVPIRDFENDNDPIGSFGDDRQYYIDLLDSLPWLKKVDIGIKELAVYENENYKPYFSSPTQLYNISSLTNLEQTFKFGQDQLKSNDFQFKLDDGHTSDTQTGLTDFFTELRRDELTPDGLRRQFNTGTDKNSKIYANNNRPVVNYEVQNKKLTFSIQKLAGPVIREANSSLVQGSDTTNSTIQLNSDNYFISTGDNLYAVSTKNATRSLGVVDTPPRVLLADTQNLIPNPSFEQGMWQDKVEDCNNYDDSAQINQRLDSNDKTDGNQALILEADKHTACTGPDPITVTPGGEYALQFDYKTEGGRQAAYEIQYLSSNSKSGTKPRKEYLYVQDNNWRQLSTLVKIPADTNQIRIVVKGVPDDRRKAHAMNWYDNFRLSALKSVLDTQIDTRPQFVQTALAPADNVNVKYESKLDYKNLIVNGSMEGGLWQGTVGDCNAYDDKGLLGMNLANEHSDGARSLQLEATRHTACTSPSAVAVKENSKYLLSFDYQSPNADNAGYYVAFNDPARTVVSEQLPIKNTGWKNFTKTITAPYGATTMQVVVYAYGSELGNQKIINRYDNFFATEVPDIADQYYLVSTPKTELKAPAAIDFSLDSPTKKTVHIKGATTGFYLAMSEAYHPQWRLDFNNSKIAGLGSWWPWTKPDAIAESEHIKLNDFQNGWYVDVPKFCAQGLCHQNADGSYDIEMVAEFAPQRWFYVGLIISGATLVGCVTFLVVARRKRKKQMPESLPKLGGSYHGTRRGRKM